MGERGYSIICKDEYIRAKLIGYIVHMLNTICVHMLKNMFSCDFKIGCRFILYVDVHQAHNRFESLPSWQNKHHNRPSLEVSMS